MPLMAAALLAVVPTIQNAKVETRSAAAGLLPSFRALVSDHKLSAPVWIGYAVPAARRENMCCFDHEHGSGFHRSAACRLEGDRNIGVSPAQGSRASLEPMAVVLYRAAHGHVGEVRVYSDDCVLDAAGRALAWFDDVKPSDSLALLRSVLDESRDEDALAAIAQHADPGAEVMLVDLARRGARGERRSQALFWLAQRASRRAVGEIDRAIAEDPETQVKRQAVFALSQLPPEEGVPRLIGLARSHRNPAVREQAFFWLGESEDPRALAFFEQILGK